MKYELKTICKLCKFYCYRLKCPKLKINSSCCECSNNGNPIYVNSKFRMVNICTLKQRIREGIIK